MKTIRRIAGRCFFLYISSMKKTPALLPFFLLSVAIFTIVSCQKEVSYEVNNNTNGGSNGGSNSSASGWSFTHTGTNYSGCIDTAYYEAANGIKVLSIEGSDVKGNSVILLLVAPNGKLSAGTYTAAQGAAMLLDDGNGNAYVSGTSASSFSFTITTVTDTSIKGTFTAALTDGANSTYVISSGSVNALIGKENPCPQNTGNGGSGGGTGGGTGSGTNGSTSGYTLVSSGSNCSDVVIGGYYNTGVALTNTNKVTIKVNVTKTGTWSVTTETVNGMKFSGSGTFTTTGAQTIVLTGSGTPTDVGSIAFPIIAGSSDCTFYIPVIAAGTAPCNPVNNTAEYSSLGTISFSFVAHDANSSYGGYTITANGNGGDITMQFPGPDAPTPGVYHVKPVGLARAVDDVAIFAVAGNIGWQSSDGNVYVTINNGKVTAVMCNVPFSGSLGGPSYTTKITAKITER